MMMVFVVKKVSGEDGGEVKTEKYMRKKAENESEINKEGKTEIKI